jgi:hypothetical protein
LTSCFGNKSPRPYGEGDGTEFFEKTHITRQATDKFDIFGGPPDTIEDSWIENVERLEEMMDEYIQSAACRMPRPRVQLRSDLPACRR